MQRKSSEAEGVSPSSFEDIGGFNQTGKRWPLLVLMCAMHRDTWICDAESVVEIRPILDHLAKDRNPEEDGWECQFTAFVAWTFQPDRRFMWQYADDPDAQKDSVSKLDHDRLAQIGANGKVRDIIDGLVEARTDEELDLINDLVNTVIYTDDTETVIPLLRATVASINKAESQ